ncbi:ANR family transcriptional regulator [Vibrio nigripulchritudo]|uniref:ANR family transcriptional regulator n=1 Tax=Vibrio nigripulchritudo TaxID=28173 RepID=UPI0003B19F29|nr:ANR family transcriptional regulator [Vibrio nigripulchritudo]CCN69758.1 hypothetical protein VIBNISFn118_150012 [Vibrio nigripulchritudo SFn118]
MFDSFKDWKKNAYPNHAEHAAKLERSGYFTEAAFAWTVAAQHARQPANRHWAESRSSFCETWARRYEQKEAA